MAKAPFASLVTKLLKEIVLTVKRNTSAIFPPLCFPERIVQRKVSQVLLCILTTLTSETVEGGKQPDVHSPAYTFCFILILAGESVADF